MNTLKDFNYACRLLAKKPGFTVLTTLVMATGIGLSIYIFTLINTIVHKPLPFKNGDSLVAIFSYVKGVIDYGDPLNLHDYHEIKTSIKGLAEFSAYRNMNINVSGPDGARRYSAVSAEPNIFYITRTEPILGRVFTQKDNQAGAENVVVIGYEVWQNRFSGNFEVIGQSIRINSEAHRVIGVMPKDYVFPFSAELWLPLREDATRLSRGDSGDVYVFAHMEAGFSMQDIDNQLTSIMQRLEQRYPKTNTGISAYITTLQESQGTRGSFSFIYVMYVASVLILILASINVGNLLLSRAMERGRETAIRMALGAPRFRLISQMLWESIIVCSFGGIIGLLIMSWGLGASQNVMSNFWYDNPPFWWKFELDGFTLKWFIAFIVFTVLITGLLPAWRNSGENFNTLLRDGTGGALTKKTGRLNRLLVVGEIFISIVILITAGILIVSSYLQIRTDYGAKIDNTLIARVNLPDSKYKELHKQVQFVASLQSQLESSDNSGDIIIASSLPGTYSQTQTVAVQGREYINDKGYPRANYISITSGSLAKLGVELKHGRYFDSGDQAEDKKSVIVTESFVARHFANESPLGKKIRLAGDDQLEKDWLTIVGVVKHIVIGDPNTGASKTPSVFRPFVQAPRQRLMIAIRIKSNRDAATQILRKSLAYLDPDLPAFRIETYQDYIDRSIAPSLFMSSIFLLLGVAAVILAGSGIYGVMSNTINQRTQEIGVKRALGAWEQRVTMEFLMSGIKQFAWGGIPGLFAGCTLGFVSSKIFGIEDITLLVIGLTISIIIGFVVILAAYLPAKRILQMEPAEALHYE